MTTVQLSADQQQIREVARRYLGDEYGVERARDLEVIDGAHTEAAYADLAAMGWTGIAVPEEHGGVGFGDVERCLLMEEMGRSVFPGPFLSTAILAADVLDALAADGSAAAAAALSLVAVGDLRATLVTAGDLHAGAALSHGVTAVDSKGRHTLDGRGGIALDDRLAGSLIVIAEAPDGQTGAFAVDADADGINREAAPLVDESRRFAHISFNGTAGTRLDVGENTEARVRAALDRSTVAIAAELVGCARQLLDMTIAYLNDRQQFGSPIGRFQALKHRAADIGVAVDAARETVLFAVDALIEETDPHQVRRAVSAAKAAASEAAVNAGNEAIQLHGAIGFTAECDVHLLYKRALVSSQLLGGPVDHRDRIAASFGL